MKISVIIPAYNCAAFIGQTLDCIYAQTMPHRDIEVIVCLDAPTDDTAAVVRDWMRAHKALSVQVIENKKNSGPSKSRNDAMRIARGEYVHFMDSDDLINVTFFADLYDAARRAAADVAVASYKHQSRPDCSVVFDTDMVVSNAQDKIDITRVDRHGMMWRYLIRRAFWTRNKFSFPTDMRVCEDWVLANKMVFAANCIAIVSRAMYMYRYRDSSLMRCVNKGAENIANSVRATDELAAFMAENKLRPSVTMMTRYDYRLFGRLRLFTVERYDNRVAVRLFGRITLNMRVRNYKMLRK